MSFGPRLFALLAFLALAMRVAVPAGWMPTADLGLAVCTGEGMAAAPAAWAEDWAKRLGKPAPTKTRADHPCAFAAAGATLAEPLPAPAPLLPAAADTLAPAIPPALIPGRGLAAPPPPPTGPPPIL